MIEVFDKLTLNLLCHKKTYQFTFRLLIKSRLNDKNCSFVYSILRDQ
jgi:hypothetical protein